MNRRPLANFAYNNKPTSRSPIQTKTLLNSAHCIKRFVCDFVKSSGVGDSIRILATVIPRANSKPRCSGGGKMRPGYCAAVDDAKETGGFGFQRCYSTEQGTAGLRWKGVIFCRVK